MATPLAARADTSEAAEASMPTESVAIAAAAVARSIRVIVASTRVDAAVRLISTAARGTFAASAIVRLMLSRSVVEYDSGVPERTKVVLTVAAARRRWRRWWRWGGRGR